MSLKYLFRADYSDDSHFTQNKEDISSQDPKKSAFYDIDHSLLTLFHLISDKHIYSVNLLNGSFAVDGVLFRMHEEPLSDFRLIFFRRHTHDFNLEHEELRHKIVYRMGWQTNDDKGNNIQRVMEID